MVKPEVSDKECDDVKPEVSGKKDDDVKLEVSGKEYDDVNNDVEGDGNSNDKEVYEDEDRGSDVTGELGSENRRDNDNIKYFQELF